ncbi:MAG: hypothetical protein ABFS46_06440 [Myxococcota bacterium]
MTLFVLSFAVLALAFAAMALGVLLGRAPLRRGCGEPGGLVCAACTRPCRHAASRAEALP